MRLSALVVTTVVLVQPIAAQPRRKPAPPPTQPAPTPGPPAPWAVGVSDAEQELALSIYRAGNAEFEESRYAQALARYREAITHWDHPAIRFNMVVCLINLDQPLEAYASVERALAHGAAPLGAEVHAQGVTYRKLLLGQLARLEVVSREPDAAITLDGAPLMHGVGEVSQLVLPGAHQIVATRTGYLTQTLPLVLVPGKATRTEVDLVELGTTTRLERRWPTWKPWVVVGTGAALALIGVPLQLAAASNARAYDDEFGTTCPTGCGGAGQPEVAPSLRSLERTARLQNVAALSLFAVGGATAIAGIVGVFLNQPRAVTPSEDRVRVVPRVGVGEAAVLLEGRF